MPDPWLLSITKYKNVQWKTFLFDSVRNQTLMDGLEKKERGTLLCKTDQVTPCFNAPVPFEKTDYVWRIALMIDSENPCFEFSCNTKILK